MQTSNGDTPEYDVSCSGEVSKRTVAFAFQLTPACEGTGGTPADCAVNPCAAQLVEIAYVAPAVGCVAHQVYAWDGSSCKAYATSNGMGMMRCKGTDCVKLFETEDLCTAAYAACK